MNSRKLAVILLAAVFLAGCTPKESRPIIALTFDDGPNTTVTPQVLDLLEHYGVKATFFLEGRFIDSTTVPVIRRAVSLGCEIANHAFDHPAMGEYTDADSVLAQTAPTDSLIEAVTGHRPAFFRPPYISSSPLMHRTVSHTFIAGQGCEDWLPEVTPGMRSTRVLESARDGQIILLHDGDWNQPTADALQTIIPGLLEKGFELVTVSDLFARKGVTPVPHEEIIYSQVPPAEQTHGR